MLSFIDFVKRPTKVAGLYVFCFSHIVYIYVKLLTLLDVGSLKYLKLSMVVLLHISC